MLFPCLFTTYTSDFNYNTELCHIQKFSDDTAIVGCVEDGQEEEYRGLIDRFVQWSEDNYLQLNVTKTEIVVDFRKHKPPPSSVCISGSDVEIVEQYGYVGVLLDSKLEWPTNTEAMYKKGLNLYFLRRLL